MAAYQGEVMNNRRKLIIVVFATLPMTCTVAAEYPTKPIRLIVPSAAGGTPDIQARLIASELTKQMGQQVVVDNRGGASGIIEWCRACVRLYVG